MTCNQHAIVNPACGNPAEGKAQIYLFTNAHTQFATTIQLVRAPAN